jgi:glyoxylase-like metal-dependent hydrolase (beta-lactamase superfamily II)
MTQSIVQIQAGALTNAFLVRGETGSLLVDTGPPGAEERLLAALAAQGVASESLTLILLTHGHTDHFGSAAALRERTGAPVAMHALDADAARQGLNQPDSIRPANTLGRLWLRLGFLRNWATPDYAPAFEPDVIFSDGMDLAPYGVTGHALHTPGHTPGSSSVLLEAGPAIIGDMVMGSFRSGLRRPGPGLAFAWDLEYNRQSLQQLLATSPSLLYVGHGGPFSPETVRAVMGL